MRFGRSIAIVAATLSAAALTSCGTNVIPGVTNNFIDGNWNLTGSGPFAQLPAISGVLIVIDNQVSGNFAIAVQCASSASIGGAGLTITGPIAPSGAFVLSQPAPTSGLTPTMQIKITGALPAAADSSWSGTYSITSHDTGCAVNQSGTFTATRYTALTGDYVGSPSNARLGSAVTLTASLTQAPAPLDDSASANQPFVIPYIPVSGTLTVTNSPCFTQGTMTTPNIAAPLAGVIGSFFSFDFSMNDGSTLTLTGEIADTAATQLNGLPGQGANLLVNGGNCAGAFTTVPFIRQ